MKHFIVPIFIPHAGCPHRCVFCNQHVATEESEPISPEEVRPYVASYINNVRNAKSRAQAMPISPRARRSEGSPNVLSGEHEVTRPPELAFYGGTFTNLSMDLQERYLSAAADLKEDGLVSGIRLSTRPDALDRERLALLRRHNVGTVELGAQSLDDEVLALTERGHTAADTIRAARAIKREGMLLGVQLMPGLPGSTLDREVAGARRVAEMEPALVRLYPTVVLHGTRLAEWFRQGRYSPLSLEDAVAWCTRILEIFEQARIRVVRIGLQSTSLLDGAEGVVAGPYHPALGALVRSRLRLERVSSLLGPGPAAQADLTLVVPPPEEPLFRGVGNGNIAALRQRYAVRRIRFVKDPALSPGSFAAVIAGETRPWRAPRQGDNVASRAAPEAREEPKSTRHPS